VEQTTQEQKKHIRNVGVLDLRNTTEESVAGIGSVGNVGVILYTRKTAPLLTRFKIGNVGASIEVPAGAILINGQISFNRAYFADLTEPLVLVVNGQVWVEADVHPEDVERSIEALYINGQIFYPRGLAGVLQSKILQINGQAMVYEPGDRLVTGRLNLDEHYLRSLEDGTSLVVLGRLSVPQVLPNDLIEIKLRSVKVFGNVTCREENAATLLPRVEGLTGSPRTAIIPAGFELIENRLFLDSASLESLRNPRLYCTRSVIVSEDVEPSALDARVETIIAQQPIIAPAAHKGVIARKCDLMQTRSVFYEAELWLVEDESELVPSRFDYLEGRATLVVTGELAISPDVEPWVLAERLAKVHNLGEIYCTREQMGAIQVRLGLSEGELLLESTLNFDTEEGGIGNVGYLTL
jgi:hypothetical protein